MLETSQDLLYLVLAFCVIWFTAFLCWALYYVMKLLRNVNETFESLKQKFTAASGLAKMIKTKIADEIMHGVTNAISSVTKKTKNKK